MSLKGIGVVAKVGVVTGSVDEADGCEWLFVSAAFVRGFAKSLRIGPSKRLPDLLEVEERIRKASIAADKFRASVMNDAKGRSKPPNWCLRLRRK